jgi:hypothetical protein
MALLDMQGMAATRGGRWGGDFDSSFNSSFGGDQFGFGGDQFGFGGGSCCSTFCCC